MSFMLRIPSRIRVGHTDRDRDIFSPAGKMYIFKRTLCACVCVPVWIEKFNREEQVMSKEEQRTHVADDQLRSSAQWYMLPVTISIAIPMDKELVG